MKKEYSVPDGYTIVSHGGIGDEHGEDALRERQKHNLSGSCHELRIHINGEILKILIDVGAYQGRGKLERNIKGISTGVSAIILTHPHMDHIGDFPRIFTEGSKFNGRVFSSPGTLQATEIALIDAAKILQRDYEKKLTGWKKTTEEIGAAMYTIKDTNKIGEKRVPRKSNGNRVSQTGHIPDRAGDLEAAFEILKKCGIDITSTMQNDWRDEMKSREPEKPAYTTTDVYAALSSIETHTIKDGWKELVPGQVAFRFYNAGHIIGSVSVLFRITHQKKPKYVLFSGDLGSYKWDMHPTGLAIPPHNLPIDTVMIESTYGARVREDFAVGLDDFKQQLIEDIKKYNRVVISTFAMDRTQNILMRLIKMKLAREIDADIVLDSPAGNKHTQAYVRNTENIDDLLTLPKATSIKNLVGADFEARERELLEEFSKYINPVNGNYQIADKDNRGELFADTTGKKKIVLTASGMADGGMVIGHLEKNISDPTTVFYFPGYLVPGTLGYALANESQPGGQQKRVLIEGKKYEVKARMKQFNFLSGHGDAEDLRAWLGAMDLRKNANILIVHGDVTGSSLEFKHSLARKGGFADKNIIVPEIEEENFFPLTSFDIKKGQKPRKSSLGPLTVEPASPQRKKIDFITQKKPTKEKPSTDLNTRLVNKNKGDLKAKNPIKEKGKIVAERKRFTELIDSIKTEFYNFHHNLKTIPLPLLQSVKKYYSYRGLSDNLKSSIDSQSKVLEAQRGRLYDTENEEIHEDKRISIDTLKTEISLKESTILKISQDLAIYEKELLNLSAYKKTSANILSQGIIESLGYSTTQIPVHSEITLLESEGEVDQIILETLMKVLEYNDRIVQNKKGVSISMIDAVSKIKSNSTGGYSTEDITLLGKVQHISIKEILDENLNMLTEKIDPNYIFELPIETKPLRKKYTTLKKIPSKPKLPQPIKESSPSGKNEKEGDAMLLGQISLLEEKKKAYRSYYREQLKAIAKDQLRLQDLKRVINKGDTPSRGKYIRLSLQEIETELNNKGVELQKIEALSNEKSLLENFEEYANLLKEIKNLKQKLVRKI